MKRDRAARRQVVQLAVKEAGNVASSTIVEPAAEVKIRVEGHRILVDVDLEGNVEASSAKSNER